MIKKSLTGLVFATAFLATSAGIAQDQGHTAIQGRILDDAGPAEILAPTDTIRDPREEMRAMIEGIGDFARKHNRNFKIAPMNAIDVMTKQAVADETKSVPARAFIRSIDGVFQEGLNFGLGAVDQKPEPEVRKRIDGALSLAKKNGLPVFVIDYAREPKNIDAAYRANAREGFISYVAPAKGEELNRLASYPKVPTKENADNILSLKDVKNFVFLRDTAALGRQDEFALKMHDTNYDLVIIDVFHGRSPLSRRAVETLKYKKTGAKRMVFAYMDVGSAASYHYYWKPNWQEGNPSFITQPTPGNPDKYFVEFWNPNWQKVIFGNANSYVYGIIKQGFDGVLIDGLVAASYFAAGDEGDLTSTETGTGFIR